MHNHSISMHTGRYSSASGIAGYFPQLLKYRDFWSISSIIKELYCITDTPLDVLKVEL